jgi:hypothetical protein
MKIGVASDAHLREAVGELTGVVPVRRGAAAVEQARGGQDRGPGADGRDPSRGSGQASNLADQPRIGGGGRMAEAAGDDEGVDLVLDPVQSALAAQLEPGVAAHRPARGSGEQHPIRRVRAQPVGVLEPLVTQATSMSSMPSNPTTTTSRPSTPQP